MLIDCLNTDTQTAVKQKTRSPTQQTRCLRQSLDKLPERGRTHLNCRQACPCPVVSGTLSSFTKRPWTPQSLSWSSNKSIVFLLITLSQRSAGSRLVDTCYFFIIQVDLIPLDLILPLFSMSWELTRRRWIRTINSKFIYDRIVSDDNALRLYLFCFHHFWNVRATPDPTPPCLLR